jgi:hypothetical protein
VSCSLALFERGTLLVLVRGVKTSEIASQNNADGRHARNVGVVTRHSDACRKFKCPMDNRSRDSNLLGARLVLGSLP